MASFLRDRLFAPAAALAVGATTALSAAPAYAEDQPRFTTASATITHQEKLRLLGQASDDARDFAEAGFNVALVIHAADDLTTAQIPVLAEHYRNMYQAALDDTYPDQGGQVQIFLAPNPGSRSTLITAYVGDGIFNVDLEKYGLPEDSDPALMNLRVAREASGDVMRVLPGAKVIQADNEARAMQSASLSAFTPGGLNR